MCTIKLRLGNGLECYYCLSDFSDHYGECNAEQPGSVVQCSNDPDMEHYGDVCSVALTSELLFAAEHSKSLFVIIWIYVRAQIFTPIRISVFIQATGEYPEEEEWWRRDCYKSPDGFLGCKNDDRTNGTMRMDVETCFCQESLCNEKIQDFTTSSTPSTTTPKGNYKIVQRVITPYQCKWLSTFMID